MGVEIKGMAELERTLTRDIPRAVSASLEDAAVAGTGPILDEAAARAPRSSNREPPTLAESMVHEVKETGPTFAVVEGGPSEDVWYAHFPEFGTRHQSAQPYLRPAFDIQAKAAAVEAARVVGKAVEDAVQ